MKWFFFLGVVVVQSDRPEIKDDVSDVIVGEIPYSMLNVSYDRTKLDDYGQITTCAGREHEPADYWKDDYDTLHRFNKITAGNLEDVHKYDDGKCNSKVMHILAKHAGCAGYNEEDAVTAVHSKYMISSDGSPFLEQTQKLIETSFIQSKNIYVCGYLMGPRDKQNGYFHLWQYFRPATEDELSTVETLNGADNSFELWKKQRDFSEAQGLKWIKLSNLVNQATPRFFPFTDRTPEPSVTHASVSVWKASLEVMMTMEENWNAIWIFCSREPILGADPPGPVMFDVPALNNSGDTKQMFFFEKLLATDNKEKYDPTPEMHGLIMSQKSLREFEEFKTCRKTHMQVLFSVKPRILPTTTDDFYLIHYEYEIPAVHHLLFEHAMFTYFTDSDKLVYGFVMSNKQEWNGFNYYHIGMVLTTKTNTDSEAWGTFTKTRHLAASVLGADWIKLDDHSNRGSPVLTKIALKS